MDYTITLPASTKVVSEEGNKGVYEIENLYPGYGNTLGNSLRRIILSSLPGAAVTSIRIEGVNHEFSSIPGVLEDMVTVSLNLKQLRFKMHGEGPETATIDLKGPRDIKGKDIKCPTQLEIANKDHHIATLTDKGANFKAELIVEKGIGFVPSEEIMKDKVPVGTLVLDAIFTPIRRANYEVENMRVGDRTDFNRLILTIETDGTLSPREAIKGALEIMKKQLDNTLIFENKDAIHNEVSREAEIVETVGQELDIKVSSRTKNALLVAGIKKPDDLTGKTKEELLELEGIGEKAVDEVKKALKKIGLALKE
jgi:DNA-directed RNA polymerase subunit alpha